MSKEDLFLKEIYMIMKTFPMSYWDAYDLPVPIRKWFIQFEMKNQEKQNSEADVNVPLTPQQKKNMIQKAQTTSDFLSPQRNRK